MGFALPGILSHSTQNIFGRLWVVGISSQSDLTIELGTGMGIGNSLEPPISSFTK
jgi:hypothetical protein